MNTKKYIEDFVSKNLEDMSFEELLESFDLSPEEAFWELFKLGHIDKELFERVRSID